MGLDYSQNKTIYYLKVVIQWILMGMVFYHSFLGMRDSDKLTFEHRIKESVRWVENNHPGYRLYMINAKNYCSEVKIGKQISPT